MKRPALAVVFLASILSTAASQFSENQKLVASSGKSNEYMGIGVALEGDVLMAGAWASDLRASNAGAVHVFEHDGVPGGQWNPVQTLLASDGAAYDGFGYSIALENGVAVVGAYYHDALAPDSGAAYVFEHDGTQWIEVQKLTASDGGQRDSFGRSLILRGGTLVIGAPGESPNPGAAYVFEHDGTQWVEVQKLVASDGESGDHFGFSGLDLDPDTKVLIIAAERHVHGSGAGVAYVFRHDGVQWVEEAELGTEALAYNVGRSAVIERSWAVIGAPASGPTGDGEAYVYRYDGGQWSPFQTLAPSDPSGVFPGDGFGEAAALTCGTLVIGAPYHFHGNGNPGAAYVYRHDGNSWVFVEELLPSTFTPNSYDRHAIRMAAWGSRLVLGAAGDDQQGPSAGAAYAWEDAQLPLDVDPDQVRPGVEFTYTLCGGQPGAPAVVLLTDASGVPLWIPVDVSVFAQDHRLVGVRTIPDDVNLIGLRLTFQSFAIGLTGQKKSSNEAFLIIQ